MMKGHYLVSYYGSAGGSGVCSDNDAAIEESADDGCTGGSGLGQRNSGGVQGDVSVVITKVEAGHGVGVLYVSGWWYSRSTYERNVDVCR